MIDTRGRPWLRNWCVLEQDHHTLYIHLEENFLPKRYMKNSQLTKCSLILFIKYLNFSTVV